MSYGKHSKGPPGYGAERCGRVVPYAILPAPPIAPSRRLKTAATAIPRCRLKNDFDYPTSRPQTRPCTHRKRRWSRCQSNVCHLVLDARHFCSGFLLHTYAKLLSCVTIIVAGVTVHTSSRPVSCTNRYWRVRQRMSLWTAVKHNSKVQLV